MKKHWLIISILILASVLRLYSLDKNPAGLNADEAAIGYNSWSLIQTGKDEHGEAWPTVFRSFDDYKPAIYFYLVLPFVKFMGLSVWAVRLPSAILGTASVLLVYLLAQKLFPLPPSSSRAKSRDLTLSSPALAGLYKFVPFLSALLLAVSPWHLQFSRGGWEVNAALFFILLGIWSFFKAMERPKYFFLFAASLALSLYTYHSARIIAPLLALTLFIIYRKSLFPISSSRPTTSVISTKRSAWRNLTPFTKTFLLSCLLGILLSLPLAAQMLSPEGQSRFSGVSVFSDTGPLWQALEMRREHVPEATYVKALHNRYLSYGLRFTKNYLSHYSPRYLFINGDEIARSKVPGMGQSYLLLVPFYFLGLLSLFKFDSKGKIFIFVWFLVAPIAAALTFQSPHALRSQNMVIPLTIITAMGLSSAIGFFLNNKSKYLLWVFGFLTFLISGYSIARYLHLYYVHYPKELPYAWQYGFDQIGSFVRENYYNYDKIIISDRYDQPYILMAFFLKYKPETLQGELVMTPRDKFGFSTVRNFGNMEFRQINYEEDKNLPKTLIISADEPVDDSAVIHTVFDPAGKPMYKFISTK